MAISDVRARDKELSQVAQGVQETIPVALKGTPLQNSADVLAALVWSLESLKAGILAIAETGNLYSTNVLFRVYLEHILKAMAVFLKASTDGNDDYAKQYIRLRLGEAKAYLKAYEAAGLDISVSHPSVLQPWFKEAAPLTRKEIDEIEKPFKYRELIRTISDLTGISHPSFLSKIIPNYCELSGFVHGGPSTFLIIDSLPTEEQKAAQLEYVADLTVSMYSSAKRWLLELAAAIRPEFLPLLDEMNEAMKDLP